MRDADTHLNQETAAPAKMSGRLKLGVFLMLVNVPLGVGGAAIAGAIVVTSEHKILWVAIGVGIYVLSWGIFGLGAWLAGKDGVQYAKELKRKWMKKNGQP